MKLADYKNAYFNACAERDIYKDALLDIVRIPDYTSPELMVRRAKEALKYNARKVGAA